MIIPPRKKAHNCSEKDFAREWDAVWDVGPPVGKKFVPEWKDVGDSFHADLQTLLSLHRRNGGMRKQSSVKEKTVSPGQALKWAVSAAMPRLERDELKYGRGASAFVWFYEKHKATLAKMAGHSTETGESALKRMKLDEGRPSVASSPFGTSSYDQIAQIGEAPKSAKARRNDLTVLYEQQSLEVRKIWDGALSKVSPEDSFADLKLSFECFTEFANALQGKGASNTEVSTPDSAAGTTGGASQLLSFQRDALVKGLEGLEKDPSGWSAYWRKLSLRFQQYLNNKAGGDLSATTLPSNFRALIESVQRG